MNGFRHGTLAVQFVISNAHGNDIVLSRSEAVTLHAQLCVALQETNNVPAERVEKPAAKK
jgi:hypothetical protein